MDKDEIKNQVREGYANIASQERSCCTPSTPCSCGGSNEDIISKQLGYSDKDLTGVPEEANLGLGCGNPIAAASLKEGDVVIDLGSGAGFDCFLAAKWVGKTGKVIGIDMTPEMIEKAWKIRCRGITKILNSGWVKLRTSRLLIIVQI